jgi:hypothetical protein
MAARRLVSGLLLGALLGLAAAPVEGEEGAPPPKVHADVFPLSAVRPGMKGHGLTVKAGTRIERFEVEVIDVMRNYLPKQDLILVRCLGEEFADHQIAQGMSGSPIYFDGRCAGALAYTWAWAKHAVGGVTPIEEMLAVGERPLEGRPTGLAPPTPLERTSGDGAELRPIGTPVAVSGFSSAGRAALGSELDRLGFYVSGGVGVGGPAAGAKWIDLDAPMAAGSALVADLVRGDYSISALGTCTYVDGDKVYGFGHPFSSLGETVIPMSVGYVYTIVASREIAFKLGGSIRPIGAIVQDRPAGIVGVMGQDAKMVPITVRFTNAVTGREERFRFEVTPNRIFFTIFTMACVRESFGRAETTLGPNTKRYRMTVKIEGMEPWSYEDIIAGFDGGFQRQLIGLLDRPLNHNSQRPAFESFDLDVTVEHRDRRAYVHTLTASADEVRPGQKVTLEVGLERKDGGELFGESLEVRIPSDAPVGDYRIAVVGGDNVQADVATPRDIADYPALYAAWFKATDLVALLPTSRVDLDVNGRLVRNVPLSSLPRLVRAPGGRGGRLRPVTEKVRRPVPYVVAGSATLTLRVVK